MSARILRGAEVVEALDAKLISLAQDLNSKGTRPTLAIVRVGEHKDDISYERGASRRAEKIGINIRKVILDGDVSQDELIRVIEDINGDDSVHGVLMFRPLPSYIDDALVRNTLDPAKDVEGITDLSLAGVFAGTGTGYAPCTPQACMEILAYYNYDLCGQNVVVIGRSLVVGKPVSMMLLGKNATITVCHSATKNLKKIASAADVLIVGVGCANMITADYMSPGQTIIDVGINVTEEGTLTGDVDFAAAEHRVSAITPVPGGVGSVTTSVLMKHVVEAASKCVE